MAHSDPAVRAEDSAQAERAARAVTLRAVSTAVVVIGVSTWWNDWASYYMAGSNISRSHFPLAFLFPFMMVAVGNLLVGRVHSAWALTGPELRLVLAMGLVAIAVPYDGVTGHLIGVLTLMRYWVPWWPLHPIGLAIQGSFGMVKPVFSIVSVWAIKSILMRIGGVGLYERGKPFFIGLIAAQAVSTALVFVVDWIWFPMSGHNVHNY